jgi:hypothetical protein
MPHVSKIISFVFILQTANAQLVDFYEAITAIETPSGVLINWTMQEGNTCNGQIIQRSLDTISYADIGEISGICGSLLEPKAYNFIDENPVFNQPVFYRIFAGGRGYSFSISTFFMDIDYGDFLVRHDRTSNQIALFIKKLSSESYQLILFNTEGKELFFEPDAKSENYINLDHQYQGVLLITLLNKTNGNIFTKKVMIF